MQLKPSFRLTIILLLFGLTYLAIHLSQAVRDVPILKPLSQFPTQIGEWKVVSSKTLSQPTIDMLGVNDYIEYNYASGNGTVVNLYVSYFSSIGVTGGYHSPRNCLPGGGWGIAELSTVRLQPQSAPSSIINSMIIQNGADRQITLYWFQNRGRIIYSEYWDKIYTVLDALFKQRRDGSFIRIMAPTREENIRETEELVKKFAEDVMVTLQDYLPGKEI
ncbi:MAG: EpsI family protein [Desulfobulbaceae bacterium DB1]|nr:MAG: EpsI family protein [Desulfobulbaceae bacterium DB1]